MNDRITMELGLAVKFTIIFALFIMAASAVVLGLQSAFDFESGILTSALAVFGSAYATHRASNYRRAVK